jgi:hypothetical protein
VRLPAGFDRNVTVSWLDARGTALRSQTYTTNERQFAVNAPSKDVAAVNVYAEDAAGTRQAIGNFDFRPPPPPAPPKSAPRAVAAKPAPPPVHIAPRPDQPDAIASNGFDTPAKAKPGAKGKAKIADKSGDRAAAKAGEKSASTLSAKSLGTAVAVQKGAGEGEP